MSGIELDPRTGEARKASISFSRILIMLVVGSAVTAAVYLMFFNGDEAWEARELAHGCTGQLVYAQWQYRESHNSYGTLEDLKQAGLLSYEVRSGTARIDEGVSAVIVLPMDRHGFRIEVSYPGGVYATASDSPDEFHEMAAELQRSRSN
jgi:hypothetical protein